MPRLLQKCGRTRWPVNSGESQGHGLPPPQSLISFQQPQRLREVGNKDTGSRQPSSRHFHQLPGKDASEGWTTTGPGWGVGRKDARVWPTPNGQWAFGAPDVTIGPSSACTRVTRSIYDTTPPPTCCPSHFTCQCWGAGSSPLEMEGSPLVRSGWRGLGIHADPQVAGTGLLFYKESLGLKSTQLCSCKHPGACLWNLGLFRICLQTEILNA